MLETSVYNLNWFKHFLNTFLNKILLIETFFIIYFSIHIVYTYICSVVFTCSVYICSFIFKQWKTFFFLLFSSIQNMKNVCILIITKIVYFFVHFLTAVQRAIVLLIWKKFLIVKFLLFTWVFVCGSFCLYFLRSRFFKLSSNDY